MSYNKRITKEQRRAIKSARKQSRMVESPETMRQLGAVSRYGK